MKYIEIIGAIVVLVLAVALLEKWEPNEQSNQAAEDTVDTIVVQEDSVVTDESVEVRKGSGNTLDLSGQGLSTVPDYVFTRTDVTELNLSNNNLSGALQAEVRHLSELESLDLSHNNFTGVPAEVGQLSKLRYLDLSYNQITGLPYELGNLSNLDILDLRGNEFSELDLNVIKAKLPASLRILVD